jgi:hypothetical protein
MTPSSVEDIGPKPELDRQLTPRERLDLYLKDQTPGSPRIQAIADRAELSLVQSRIDRGISERRRILKEPSKIEPLNDDFLSEVLMQKAVVGETMRKRQFGVHAAEYNAALEGASSLLRDYYNREYNQRGDESRSENDIRESASNNLLRDLWHINNKLSAME